MDLLPHEAEDECAFRATSPVSDLTFRIRFDETAAAEHLGPFRQMSFVYEHNMQEAAEALVAAATGEPNMNREIDLEKTLNTPEGVVVLTMKGRVSDSLSDETISNYVVSMMDTVDL